MKVLILVGATCSDKTGVAYFVAKKVDAEIIFADSMKVYKYMNIGTAKPLSKYRKDINFHLLDIIEPFGDVRERFNASKFVELCLKKLEEIFEHRRIPLIVCGTPMYLHLLLKGHFSGATRDENFRKEMSEIIFEQGGQFLYEKLKSVDPIYASKIHSNDIRRIVRALEVFHITGETMTNLHKKNTNCLPYPYLILGIRRSREDIYERVNKRVDRMIEGGFIEEVKNLLSKKTLNLEATQAIGYKQLIDYIEGRTDLKTAIVEIKKKTRHLARRQLTWFKNFDVDWIDINKDESSESASKKFVEKYIRFLEG